jgi:hypothetical protein
MIEVTKTLSRMRDLITHDLGEATGRQAEITICAALIALAENVEQLTVELKASLELHRAAVYQGLDEIHGGQR